MDDSSPITLPLKKKHCANYVIISPKCFNNLVQVRILPQFFFSFDTKNCSPLLGGRYAIGHCWWCEVSAVAPYINQSYHSLNVLCCLFWKRPLTWFFWQQWTGWKKYFAVASRQFFWDFFLRFLFLVKREFSSTMHFIPVFFSQLKRDF